MRFFFALIEALRCCWCFRDRRGWWRKFPFLPLPARDFIEWRISIVYGVDAREALTTWQFIKDTYGFLLWRRQMRIIARR